MDRYTEIADQVDAPLKEHLTLVSHRIEQPSQAALEYQQKYNEIEKNLSTTPGLPGLVDLMDLSYHLGLKLDQSHFSKRASTRRVTPLDNSTKENTTNIDSAEKPIVKKKPHRRIQIHVNCSDSDSDDSSYDAKNNHHDDNSVVSQGSFLRHPMIQAIWQDSSSNSDDDHEEYPPNSPVGSMV